MGGKFHPQGLNMGKKGPNRTQEVPKEAKNSLKGKNIVRFCLKKPDLSHLLWLSKKSNIQTEDIILADDFMIGLFFYSLYFWISYKTDLSSSFNPIGSFSRTLNEVRIRGSPTINFALCKYMISLIKWNCFCMKIEKVIHFWGGERDILTT